MIRTVALKMDVWSTEICIQKEKLNCYILYCLVINQQKWGECMLQCDFHFNEQIEIKASSRLTYSQRLNYLPLDIRNSLRGINCSINCLYWDLSMHKIAMKTVLLDMLLCLYITLLYLSHHQQCTYDTYDT